MSRIKVERLGGFAGIGLAGSALRSEGEVALADLSPADRAAVDALFAPGAPRRRPRPDAFRYRITRGDETVEVAEDGVPAALRDAVRDRFA